MANEYEGGIGDQPVEGKYHELMERLAHALDEILNKKEKPKKVGFVLLMFDFNDNGGRCNYISNARRVDIAELFKEQIKRFEEDANANSVADKDSDSSPDGG